MHISCILTVFNNVVKIDFEGFVNYGTYIAFHYLKL